ncbi:hypothetical protein NVSP9465_04373 [Novosphingobium sp. CECT 9465]|nr:hypothetical protein NVSP9465_04373 [Novosphingobium sp. CECT 9465]
MNVLQDRPELDAVAGHEAHSALDGFEAAEGGELIEQEQDGAGGGGRRARQIGQPLRQHQAQPPGIGGEPIGRQHQIDGCGLRLHIGEGEIRAAQHGRHARGIEKMGMALRGRQHAGRFAVGLAQVAVGGTRDQAPRLRAARHFPQHPLGIIRREGEAVAQGFQRVVLALRLRVTGHPQEDTGDQRLGFLVPMRLASFAGSVIDQRVGQRHGVVGEIEAGRVEAIERVERG